MSTKILSLICFVGISHAVFIDPTHKKDSFLQENAKTWQMVKVYHPPRSQSLYDSYDYGPYTYPKYEFEYAVSDKKTGDHKRHYETRDGDKVTGEYSLVEPDGSIRKVQYDANDFDGFKAVVSKTFSKHGDHAYSVMGHTRHFFPIGNGIKINHYFPGKDYQYKGFKNTENETEKNEKKSAPENENESSPKVEEKSVEMPEPVMLFKPVVIEPKIVEEPKATAVVPVEEITAKAIPTVISMIMSSDETPKVSMVPVENVESVMVKEESKEDQKSSKAEPSADSDAASSYYHSRYYYVTY